MSKIPLPVIVILGPWSSGTTAITGYIARLGAYSCPPHVMTRDEKTPDAHESQEFRRMCMATVSEQTFKDIGCRAEFKSKFQNWLLQQCAEAKKLGRTSIVLKHPLSAFLMSEIEDVCSPYWVFVTRPFKAIDATRRRRNWPANFGAAGAQAVYGAIVTTLIEANLSALMLSFPDFVEDQNTRRSLLNFLGSAVRADAIQEADAWIRR